jgi:hypothetical protein
MIFNLPIFGYFKFHFQANNNNLFCLTLFFHSLLTTVSWNMTVMVTLMPLITLRRAVRLKRLVLDVHGIIENQG